MEHGVAYSNKSSQINSRDSTSSGSRQAAQQLELGAVRVVLRCWNTTKFNPTEIMTHTGAYSAVVRTVLAAWISFTLPVS
jgi:hypothetical protein